MRLITHNMMCCIKCQSFPLDIADSQAAPAESAYDANFVRRMIPRIEYSILVGAFQQLKEQNPQVLAKAADIPPTLEGIDADNDDAPELKAIHFALHAVAVRSGKLVCPKCTTEYAIAEFIPNMMVE